MRTTKVFGHLPLTLLLFLGGGCDSGKAENRGGPPGTGGGPAGSMDDGSAGSMGGGSAGSMDDGSAGSMGGGSAGGVGGSSAGSMGGGAGSLLCTDLLQKSPFNPGGVPGRCCPRPPPDCSDKPDGFTEPGETGRCVDAKPGGSSFCSCTCTRGEWSCGC